MRLSSIDGRWSRFDLTLVLVSVTAWIPTETYVRQLGPGALTFVTVVKLVVILRICRLFVFIDTWSTPIPFA